VGPCGHGYDGPNVGAFATTSRVVATAYHTSHTSPKNPHARNLGIQIQPALSLPTFIGVTHMPQTVSVPPGPELPPTRVWRILKNDPELMGKPHPKHGFLWAALPKDTTRAILADRSRPSADVIV